MSQYASILDRLFQATNRSRLKTALDNACALNEKLDFPTTCYPTIHIAGSNGKGSVAAKIAKALELSGYRVGLYTSPHLFCFRERMTINAEPISEDDVISGLERIFLLNDTHQLNANFFEMTTFLAFDYFRRQNVDVAVIETGLGGRLDATNVICPELSVITSISREHIDVLGDQIEQIASEKAGIIKEKIPVVLGPKARCQAIYDQARHKSSPVFASNKISHFYDEENSAIAQLALEQLTERFTITEEALAKGLLFRPACRFEIHGNVIFDVAHNPEAIFSLLQALHSLFPATQFRFLVGFSKDKEYDRCLELIADVAVHIHLTQADSPRAAPIDALKNAMQSEDPSLYSAYPSIPEAAEAAAAEAAAKGEILVVCGSFYIMAEAKEILTQLVP